MCLNVHLSSPAHPLWNHASLDGAGGHWCLILSTENPYIPDTCISVSSNQSHTGHQSIGPAGGPQPLAELSWPMLSLWFSTSSVCLRLELFSRKPFPLVTAPSTKQLRPMVSTPLYKAISGTLWKPLPVSNFSLTGHLFFLLAPRQPWDQIQAPLSCSRDKMACVVLGFCDCRWVPFLGFPSLLLGPVLNANPAGFRLPCPFYSTISGGGCSFLSHNELHMHVHQSWWSMSEHWSNTTKPSPTALWSGGGWNLLYRIQELVVVCRDGSWGKFGWSEGDVLEILKMGYRMIYNKAGKVHL